MLAILSRLVFSLAQVSYPIKSSLSKRARLAVNKTDGAAYVWFI